MKTDIAFGQYCEGNSILHRLDPRAKILFTVLFIVTIFLAKNLFAFLLLVLFTVLLVGVSGIPVRIVFSAMRPLLFIILFTAIINIFWMPGERLLLAAGPVRIYAEGVLNAVLIVIRILLLLVGTGMFLTYTTTPIALTDGLEQLLQPLKKLRVPVHEFSMMMTIALRFIPTLMEETNKIMNAQKARGADFSDGNLIKKARAMIPILVPLFVSSFRRADELATAMECRCYTGGEGRTRMNVLHFGRQDAAACAVLLALCAGVIVINLFAPGPGLAV